MNFIFSETLFTFFVLALYFSIETFRKGALKYTENRLFAIFCLSSAIWSLGFFGVIIQTDPENAYVCRAFGMIGTFAYLISAQFLICHLCGIKKLYRYILEGFSFLGVIIYFFVIQKEMVTYHLSEIGMTYSFNSGLWNNLYIAYSVILAINMLCVIIYVLFTAKTQRLKELGKKLLLTEIIIVLGMLLDTIFPLIGKTAIPGSSLAQFVGLAVMYHTITFVSHSRINISNMSEFIYYSLTVPVLVCNSTKQLQILNDTAYSFFGIEKNNTLSDTGLEQLFNFKEDNIFNFESKSHDVDAICRNNNLYCSLSINKIKDDYDDLIGYIIIVTDLSERMKSMEKLEAAMKEAEYANQAKSTFLANMSHEIRTPMNAIVGFSELTLKMELDNQVRKNVEDIKWASHNLLAIINDILDISKIESGKTELVLGNYYTSTLLNDVSLIISSQAEKKGLEFNVLIDENIPSVLYGDKVRLRGVLINILNNAVKYTQKGHVTFEASILDNNRDTVKLEFKISDTGIGIRKENMGNLFKSFERLDQKQHHKIEGSGLGLAIANGYITLMGGKIDVDSTYGKGSIFTVTLEQKVIDSLPIKEDYANHKNTNADSSLMRLNGLPVLVVDDNLINLRVAHGLLSYYGLSVDTASNGEDAIELCKKKSYSLVFLDQMMPVMDGIQTMKHIRSLSSHYDYNGACKVIVLTADAIKGSREYLMENGFDEYLGKPINLKQLERLFVKFISPEKITYVSSDKTTDNLEISKSFPAYLDVSNGISNCGGNFNNYVEILKITFQHGHKQLAELDDFLEQKDYENFIIKIHSIKSTSLNIGARELSDLAKKQEEEGRAGNLSYIDEHYQSFRKLYSNLLNDLEQVLIKLNVLTPCTNDLEALDEAMVPTILNNIERCIDDFNFSKIFVILEDIKKYTLPKKYATLFAKIEELMENLSVDDIKELLHEANTLS